ncbi:MAG: oxidoreductase [Pseudomonadota bacterium]|jgi:2,4-dienoyl-CoA reductase-like NADH-dependent reductase (Old Yellow Enzyme family)
MTVRLSDPLPMARGPALANRVMLAPLTNFQSHDDGTLGDDELHWLRLRAQGGFGLTMTCAAYVNDNGKGFPGQLGISSDRHLPGLQRLAAAIHAAGSVSSVQLQHSGRRSKAEYTGQQPVCPWDDAETGARALTTAEVQQVVQDFVDAAVRAEAAGFQGVELHGAHGYLLAQFLDGENNRRDDGHGGSFEHRTRILFETIAGVRARTGPNFQLGLRLSPERFGIQLAEARELARQVLAGGQLDYLDLSLWDAFKEPVEAAFKGQPLIDHFTNLPRHGTRVGVAGKIMSAATAQACLEHGADFVLIGRGAILHHDFARRAMADAAFKSVPRPVTRAYLAGEGVGPAFIHYLKTEWRDFVAD